jgi:hypothetical protein
MTTDDEPFAGLGIGDNVESWARGRFATPLAPREGEQVRAGADRGRLLLELACDVEDVFSGALVADRGAAEPPRPPPRQRRLPAGGPPP